jgi:hypothetical protein
MGIARQLLLGFAVCLTVACGSGGSAPPVVDPGQPVTHEQSFVVLTERTLDADGPGVGLTAYQLIRDFGGVGSIESPDLYPVNHPGIEHIFEAVDGPVGNHFVFVIHRDIDIDRDRLDITDRQRNEIKTYGGSEEAVKGFEDETFIFTWKFKINAAMEISTYFSHFFQLKAVGGDDDYPILTITGAERNGEDGIEVRHSPLQTYTVLQRTAWADVTGEWLEAYCRVTFSESGELRLIVKRLGDGNVIFNIDESNLDFWRGGDAGHFVRPKWGIYRSLLDVESLRPEEENVRFANFSIREVTLVN